MVYNLGIHNCKDESARMNVWHEAQASRVAQELPEEFTGVEILNRPVVSARAKVNHCTVSGKKNVSLLTTEYMTHHL